MKLIFKIIGGFILLFMIVVAYLYFLGTADLRTEFAKNNTDEQHARVLLQEMGVAHGIQNWKGVNTYSVILKDEFYGAVGSMGHGYLEDTVELWLEYIPNTYDGKLEFLTGEASGHVWGIQSWKTYIISPLRGLKFRKKEDITFWLPTYQYFIEFPLRIQNADAVNYAGEKLIDGKKCEGVLASWKTTEPQRDIDQYLVWLDAETKRIVKLEYTVRDMYNFLRGAAYYQDYKSYDGILFPSKMPVESNLVKEGLLHQMSLSDFEKNPVTQKSLRPNNALPVMGDEK